MAAKKASAKKKAPVKKAPAKAAPVRKVVAVSERYTKTQLLNELCWVL